MAVNVDQVLAVNNLKQAAGQRRADEAARRREKQQATRESRAAAAAEALRQRQRKEKAASNLRGPPPPLRRNFRLPPDLLPDLLVVWEFTQVKICLLSAVQARGSAKILVWWLVKLLVSMQLFPNADAWRHSGAGTVSAAAAGGGRCARPHSPAGGPAEWGCCRAAAGQSRGRCRGPRHPHTAQA